MPSHTADRLADELSNNEIVLRITDNNSITQRDDITGYTASSHFVDSRISRDEWRRRYQGVFPNWQALGSRDVDDIIDHVRGGWNGYGSARPSDWISTSACLVWTIWEIARRLHRKPSLDIELAVIRRKFHAGYKGAKPVRLDAYDVLRLHQDRRDHRHYDMDEAIRFAKASSEFLYYGRIFDKDIIETTWWTDNQKGFPLPLHFCAPKKRTTGMRWIYRLAWDINDDFWTAWNKVEERKEQIESSRKPRRRVW